MILSTFGILLNGNILQYSLLLLQCIFCFVVYVFWFYCIGDLTAESYQYLSRYWLQGLQDVQLDPKEGLDMLKSNILHQRCCQRCLGAFFPLSLLKKKLQDWPKVRQGTLWGKLAHCVTLNAGPKDVLKDNGILTLVFFTSKGLALGSTQWGIGGHIGGVVLSRNASASCGLILTPPGNS